jgi:hypothetical protein
MLQIFVEERHPSRMHSFTLLPKMKVVNKFLDATTNHDWVWVFSLFIIIFIIVQTH